MTPGPRSAASDDPRPEQRADAPVREHEGTEDRDGSRSFDDALDNQFPRHGTHQVFIDIERLQSFAGKFSLHHQGHEHLLAHEPQTRLLHRARVRGDRATEC